MQHRPKLLVFDEPTSGLDPLMQTEFLGLIKEYVTEGATCMLSSHVLPEIKCHCNHVAIMKDGKLQRLDTVSNITRTDVKRIRMIRDGKQEDFIWCLLIKRSYFFDLQTYVYPSDASIIAPGYLYIVL